MNNQLQSTSIKLPSTMNKSTFLLKKNVFISVDTRNFRKERTTLLENVWLKKLCLHMSKVKDVSTMYCPLELTEKFVKTTKILFTSTIPMSPSFSDNVFPALTFRYWMRHVSSSVTDWTISKYVN